MVFDEESTVAAFLLRARREGTARFRRLHGPTTAFHILQGIETLPLRMQRHVDNTRKIVAFLAAHAAVEAVVYPELPDHPDHALAKQLLPQGCGAVFTFERQGRTRERARFIERCAFFAPRQRRRRQVARDPSGEHDALPHGRRGAARGRHRRRHDPAVGRARRRRTI